MLRLTAIERRVLAHLDQHGASHRRDVVWALASPESKIGYHRDSKRPIGGAGSGHAEAMIMGAWCQRLVKQRLVRVEYDENGWYRHHRITADGVSAIRSTVEAV